MAYENLADLIENHKRELALKATEKAIVINLIDETQIETDVAGFEDSFVAIASYVRTNNTQEWRNFVERITRGQVERGVSDESGRAIADFMMESIHDLIDLELGTSIDKALAEKFRQRLVTLHSLGRVTIIITQVKARSGK